MKLLFRLILISMFGFAYSNCWDIDNQADCVTEDHCEWHSDDSACEDAEGGHDDHDHGEEDECDDCLDYCVSYVMENYGYTLEQGTEWCSACLLYTSPSPRDRTRSRMPSSA